MLKLALVNISSLELKGRNQTDLKNEFCNSNNPLWRSNKCMHRSISSSEECKAKLEIFMLIPCKFQPTWGTWYARSILLELGQICFYNYVQRLGERERTNSNISKIKATRVVINYRFSLVIFPEEGGWQHSYLIVKDVDREGMIWCWNTPEMFSLAH